jgi:hypothetical protein
VLGWEVMRRLTPSDALGPTRVCKRQDVSARLHILQTVRDVGMARAAEAAERTRSFWKYETQLLRPKALQASKLADALIRAGVCPASVSQQGA